MPVSQAPELKTDFTQEASQTEYGRLQPCRLVVPVSEVFRDGQSAALESADAPLQGKLFGTGQIDC